MTSAVPPATRPAAYLIHAGLLNAEIIMCHGREYVNTEDGLLLVHDFPNPLVSAMPLPAINWRGSWFIVSPTSSATNPQGIQEPMEPEPVFAISDAPPPVPASASPIRTHSESRIVPVGPPQASQIAPNPYTEPVQEERKPIIRHPLTSSQLQHQPAQPQRSYIPTTRQPAAQANPSDGSTMGQLDSMTRWNQVPNDTERPRPQQQQKRKEKTSRERERERDRRKIDPRDHRRDSDQDLRSARDDSRDASTGREDRRDDRDSRDMRDPRERDTERVREAGRGSRQAPNSPPSIHPSNAAPSYQSAPHNSITYELPSDRQIRTDYTPELAMDEEEGRDARRRLDRRRYDTYIDYNDHRHQEHTYDDRNQREHPNSASSSMTAASGESHKDHAAPPPAKKRSLDPVSSNQAQHLWIQSPKSPNSKASASPVKSSLSLPAPPRELTDRAELDRAVANNAGPPNVGPTMIVTVKRDGLRESFDIEISLSASVGGLKSKLKALTGMCIREQRLSLGRVVLHPDLKISSLREELEDVGFLSLSKRSGMWKIDVETLDGRVYSFDIGPKDYVADLEDSVHEKLFQQVDAQFHFHLLNGGHRLRRPATLASSGIKNGHKLRIVLNSNR